MVFGLTKHGAILPAGGPACQGAIGGCLAGVWGLDAAVGEVAGQGGERSAPPGRDRPEAHPKRIRTTNLLEGLFGKGQRRAKVILRCLSDQSGLSLRFAVLVDAWLGGVGPRSPPA